jgi:hypothetical protein
MHHRRVRLLFLLALLAAAPCGAQDLPDPGRRLSKEEQDADPDKPRPAAKAPAAHPEHARDARACERARVSYQLFCGAPSSPRSRSMDCAEAYAFYRQSCP